MGVVRAVGLLLPCDCVMCCFALYAGMPLPRVAQHLCNNVAADLEAGKTNADGAASKAAADEEAGNTNTTAVLIGGPAGVCELVNE